MKSINYKIIEETIHSEEFGEYNTFGLQVEEITNNDQCEIHILHDVTTNKDAATEMVRLFNEEQLEAIHFEEVVQDMI